jgi:long-chain acyl-CoA synthetase
MIHSFYHDRTLLLTGGTGFVGQALCAKLLRHVQGVRRIYLLIRPRRRPNGTEVSPAERLEHEFFTSSVFESFRREDPEGFSRACAKVHAVPFEIGKANLGLAEEDRQLLAEEIDVLVNSAATVVFDEPLDLSLQLNTLGPLELLQFVQSCRREVVFVHVSTAYVNGQMPGVIHEEPLPLDRTIRQMMDGESGFDPEQEIAVCQEYCRKITQEGASPARREAFRSAIQRQRRSFKLSGQRLEQMVEDRARRWCEKKLVDEGMRRAKEYGWNDVYTFTKAMGEQMLVKKRGDTPLSIVRPSIIESSLRYPEPGWITGLKVTDPLIAAYGRGMIPDFPARPHMVIDLIPVDYVANAIIAAAPQAAADQVKVFQVATSAANPIRLSELFDYVRSYFLQFPMLDRQGNAPKLPQWSYPSLRKFHAYFRLRYLWPLGAMERLYGRLPAGWVSAQKKRLVSTLKVRLERVLYYTDIYHPYTHLSCSYSMERTRDMHAALPEDERHLFDLDVKGIDWPTYIGQIHIPGLRRHVIKDDAVKDDGAESLFKEPPSQTGAEEDRWQAAGEMDTLPELFKWAGSRYTERVAWQVRRGEGWARYGYAEAYAAAEAMAAAWQGQGLEAGDRVILMAENKPEWMIHYMALAMLGAVVVPLDSQVPGPELERVRAFVQARALILSKKVGQRLEVETGTKSKAGAESEKSLWFNLDNWGQPWGQSDVEMPTQAAKWNPPKLVADDTALILFTAGRAPVPRGVVLSHGNLLADLLALAQVQRVYEDDQVLSLLPLHLGLEFTGSALMALWAGATTTYINGLSSRAVLEAMAETGTTAMVTVPRLLKMIADRVDRTGAGAQTLQAVRLLVCGGAPLPVELFDRYAAMGVAVYEGYGLTEAGPVVAVNPPAQARRGAVGRLLSCVEMRLDGEGPDAEILLRGPNVFGGYFADETASAAALENGWLRTGDCGYLDKDGYLHISGRRKELIVTGAGKNVYPQDIESHYADLSGVAELAVVGLPEARTAGEAVHGVAVLERGETDGKAVREGAFRVSRNLPGYRRIQRLHLWQRPLPRGEDGQVDRIALAADIGIEPLSDLADEGLPQWERQVIALVARICGLSSAEVAAHREAPLDTLLDSLMAIEFVESLNRLAGIEVVPFDRGERTLRQILDEYEAPLQSFFQNKGTALGPESESAKGPNTAEGPQLFWRQMAGSATATSRSAIRPKVLALVGTPMFRRYYTLQVEGQEFLPQDRPFLLAANHTSHLDAMSVLAAARPRIEALVLAVAGDHLEQHAFQEWGLGRLMHTVPFERPEIIPESLARLRAMLVPRQPTLIFPEGRRAVDGKLQPFKSGIGMVALEMELPVVPVRLDGAFAAWPKGGKMQRRPLQVRFGEPVEMQAYLLKRQRFNPYEIYREIAEELRRRIEAMQ